MGMDQDEEEVAWNKIESHAYISTVELVGEGDTVLPRGEEC